MLRIERNQADISRRLAQAPGQETATLAVLLREHEGDTEFLLPALESKFASPDDLDRFARSDDLGLTLTALRNANCRSETLVRIHRTHSYPDYFLQTLSAHPNTPPELLREIHGQNPRRIDGLDRWLARNPATPLDVLEALTRSTDPNVIQGLLQNPRALLRDAPGHRPVAPELGTPGRRILHPAHRGTPGRPLPLRPARGAPLHPASRLSHRSRRGTVRGPR